MIRLLTTASLSALLLAACAPETPPRSGDTQAEASGQGESTAEPAMAFDMPGDFQLSWSEETEAAAVSSEIDPAILAFDPQLAYRLWTDARSALGDLQVQAAGDKTLAEKDSAVSGEPSWFHQYTMEIRNDATLVLDDLISIEHFVAQYTGGAHGNYFTGGGIYRKGSSDALKVSEMIADPVGFRDLVVTGLVAEKLKRGWGAGEEAGIRANLTEMLTPSADYPDVFESHVVLHGSSQPGKAGGVVVLFSPYEVGSFAEGIYEVLIPASDLVPLLAADWKDRFGGTPLPLSPD
ncbi:MAG: hypothetical protein ACK4HR_03805 [Hyphomonas sp.]|jgi:hypothetical protein